MSFGLPDFSDHLPAMECAAALAVGQTGKRPSVEKLNSDRSMRPLRLAGRLEASGLQQVGWLAAQGVGNPFQV